jgi:hypothetical protein
MVTLDVADKHHPKHVSTLPVYPPLGSTIAVHSAVPLPDRDVVVINSEALREECDEPASNVASVDISNECNPILMSVFPQPRQPHGYEATDVMRWAAATLIRGALAQGHAAKTVTTHPRHVRMAAPCRT